MSTAVTVEPGDRDLALALSRHTASVLQSNWMVGAVLAISPLAEIAVVLQNPAGANPSTAPVYPNVLPSDAASYAGARLEFVSGILGGITPASNGSPSPYGRISTTIKSVTTNLGPPPSTVMVLNDPLPVAPSPGDRFIIYRQVPTGSVSGTVTANQGTAGTQAWPVSESTIDGAGGAPGAAAPAKALQVAGNDGTDLRVLATDASGAVKLAAGSNTIGAINQGAAGSTPWYVTTTPFRVANAVADGTAVSANQALFTASASIPADGMVLFTVDVDASGNAAELQVTRDSGAHWSVCLSGMQLQPGQEYAVAFQVSSGDAWNVSFAGATTIRHVCADFVNGL
jgi:hypothetical protein